MSKNVVETEGPRMTSQYGAYALRAGLARLHACMRMHTPARLGIHVHARTHAQACTQRPVCITYCFSTTIMLSWTRLNVTLYVHCYIPHRVYRSWLLLFHILYRTNSIQTWQRTSFDILIFTSRVFPGFDISVSLSLTTIVFRTASRSIVPVIVHFHCHRY